MPFVYFWLGGMACMLMVLWADAKRGNIDELVALSEAYPLRALAAVLLAVFVWPGFIVVMAFTYAKKEEKPATLPDLGDDFGALFRGTKPGECFCCGHEKIRHVDGFGCNECRGTPCTVFVETTDVPMEMRGPWVLCECGKAGAIRRPEGKCDHV